jgi:D-proline reductase (dithiol) PrdB
VNKFEMKQLKDKVIARLITRYPSLLNRWARKARIVRYSETPWTLFTGDAVKSRLALITSGGFHLKSQPPFDMRDREGDPSFREIPADAKPDSLSITHNYYDQRDAVRDINIVFPLERVRLLEQFGEIGQVNHRHFSFMGHISNRHLDTLINETAPGVAEKLRGDSVDIALFTPA